MAKRQRRSYRRFTAVTFEFIFRLFRVIKSRNCECASINVKKILDDISRPMPHLRLTALQSWTVHIGMQNSFLKYLTTLDVDFSTPYQNIVIFRRELFSNKCKCIMYKASAIHHTTICARSVYVACNVLANTKADRKRLIEIAIILRQTVTKY